MHDYFLEWSGTACFVLAVLHTFSVKWFMHLAKRYPGGSPLENFFHLLGEIEVVFGLWSAVFLSLMVLNNGATPAISFLESLNFTEPVFVFVIMVTCSTKPVLDLAGYIINFVARHLPLSPGVAFFSTTLTIGPLLGSLITEPAAMTVTALLLINRLYSQSISPGLKYATIGLLFVNVSIGGTLTPFAAPPVLMVARKWGWDLSFMLSHFGWRAVLAIVISTAFTAWRFRAELTRLEGSGRSLRLVPNWVSILHLLFLFAIVATSHFMVVFVGLFLIFLGLVTVTREYQKELSLREPMLVAFFLGGLVVLGSLQRWWLEPLLGSLTAPSLYLGSMLLTSVTDNAALTYLGSQVPGLGEASKIALVAGSVVGGGLTVIANAPNPAGFGILKSAFGDEGISPLGLFRSALLPTLIAGVCFWFL